MGRLPCCEKGVKKGAWTAEEDKILVDYISKNGHGTWRSVPKNAGNCIEFYVHWFSKYGKDQYFLFV